MKPASEMGLSELIAETADPSLSMASGGTLTIEETLAAMMLRPGSRYVEVGCAAGWMAVRVARCRPDLTVIGIDPQPAAISAARETAAEWGIANALFTTGDARSLFLASDSCEGVFAGNIPTFVPSGDRATMLGECIRVLAPGGTLVAVPMYYPSDLPSSAVLAAVEQLIGAPIHRGTEGEWIDWYERAGLRLVSRRAHRFAPHTPAEIRTYVDRVMGNPTNARHLPERRAELRERLREVHTLFGENNAKLGYSVLGFRVDDSPPGPNLLDALPSEG